VPLNAHPVGRLKRSLIQGVTVAGFRLAKTPVPESLEHHLKRLFARLGVTDVVDVGAHHGEFAETLRRHVGYKGRIHSFEPAGEAFGRLCARAASDALWDVWNVALGSKAGQRELKTYADTMLNSLKSPNYFGSASHAGLTITGSEEVVVERLDAFPGLGVDDDWRMLLKIDAQGTDLDVLEGAAGIMPQVVALQIEAAVRPIYDGAPALGETLELLDAANFVPSGFFPVGRRTDLCLVDVDVIALRRGS
jgi:FkbM family methyltransferase